MTLNTVYNKVLSILTLFSHEEITSYNTVIEVKFPLHHLYILPRQPPPQNQYSRQCDCFWSRLFPALCHIQLTATVSYVMLPRLSEVNGRKQLEGKQKNMCPVQYTCKSGRVELQETKPQYSSEVHVPQSFSQLHYLRKFVLFAAFGCDWQATYDVNYKQTGVWKYE